MAETIYQVVTMNGVQYYTRKQFDKKYPKQQPNTNQRLRDEIRNAPVVRELLGPMWGGTKDGKNVVRYEDADTYKRLSETKERIKSKANINLDFISEVTVDDMALTDNQKKGWLRELVYDLARLAKISPTAFVITDINVNSSGSMAAAQINPTKSASFDIVCKSEGINTRGDEVEWSYKFSNGVDKIDNLEKDEAVILFGNLVTHSVFDYKEPLKIKLDADTVGEALKIGLEDLAFDFVYDCLRKVSYIKHIELDDKPRSGWMNVFVEASAMLQDGDIYIKHPKYSEKVQGLQQFYKTIKLVLDYDRNIDCAFRIIQPRTNLMFASGINQETLRVYIEFRT